LKQIAHRGLFKGEDPQLENKPTQIDLALNNGFECEIDLWVNNNKLFLGHDDPVHEIDQDWLRQRASRLWIHCKNLEALNNMLAQDLNFNYFWHQSDDYTLTSKGVIWVYPERKFNENCIIVILELSEMLRVKSEKAIVPLGICSKFIGLT
jgi:hypothetical protein